MRKSFSIFVVAAWGIFTVLTASAQKTSSFAGTVKMSVKYEGNTNPQIHMPHNTTYTILGNKFKVISPPGIIQIADGDAGAISVLYDIPGHFVHKTGYKMSKEEFEEAFESKKLTYTKKEGDTMTICGYLCTRYDIAIYDTEEDEETMVIVYTTTEIGENNNINAFEFPGLTGFPLYQETEANGVKTIAKAIEIKKTKIKSVDFLTPEGYKIFPSRMEWGMFYQAASEKNGE